VPTRSSVPPPTLPPSPAESQPGAAARPGRVLLVLSFTAVLIWMDATVLAVALERLADPRRGLGASPGDLQWAVGAYSLTFATVLFVSGALGDRRGHRTILAAGIVTFGAASVWAAWSPTALQLILARGLMGAGGAMIMPSSMAILAASFPPEKRAAAIGTFSASSGVGLACGPMLGGALIDHFWWGSVFLINVPVVVIALIGVRAVVPPTASAASRRLDLVGIALSTAGLLLLAYGLIEGGQAGGWDRGRVWGSLAGGVAVLAAFVVTELRQAEPSFDPRLFADRRFAAGNIALGAMFLAMAGQSFYSSFYLQGARGMSPWTAGLLSLPAALGVVVGAPTGARLVRRFGFPAIAAPALGLLGGATALNALFTAGTPLAVFCLVGAVAGVGGGATVAPTTAAVIASLPPARIGAGSAVNNTVRQVGSLLGVAVLGTVLATAYRRGIGPSLTGLPPAERALAQPSAEATRRVALTAGRPRLLDAANDAFMHAMHVTALCAGGIALAGALGLALAFRSARASAGPAPAAGPGQPVAPGPAAQPTPVPTPGRIG